MSMTIDLGAGSRSRSAARMTAAAFGVLAVWFLGLAGVTAALEPEDTVIVFGPERRLFAALAASDVLLVSNGPGYLRLRGRSSGFVVSLYGNGAWLVLPGTAVGCGAIGGGTTQSKRTV
jgi:hypothetical protein